MAADNVPVVVRFSLSKLIDPPIESTMIPSCNDSVPKSDPDANALVPPKSNVPVAENVPSTMTFSLMFTVLESVAVMVVPELNPMPSIMTEPDPLGTIFRSSLLLTASILLSLNLIPGNSIDPVPLGCTSMSESESLAVILLPKNLISDCTTVRLKKSVKLLFILLPASYNESPLPSSAFTPTFIIS